MPIYYLSLKYPIPRLRKKRTPRNMLQHYIQYNKDVDKLMATEPLPRPRKPILDYKI